MDQLPSNLQQTCLRHGTFRSVIIPPSHLDRPRAGVGGQEWAGQPTKYGKAKGKVEYLRQWNKTRRYIARLYLYLEPAPYVGQTDDILMSYFVTKYDVKCVYAAGGGWMRPPPTHDITLCRILSQSTTIERRRQHNAAVLIIPYYYRYYVVDNNTILLNMSQC